VNLTDRLTQLLMPKEQHSKPSQIWIFNDNNYADQIHFPDRLDNHGIFGGNVAFVDGHVEWVSASKYVYSYELSQDDNRETIGFKY
jgi:prepilin-type processing-associated H-X9-DG protein